MSDEEIHGHGHGHDHDLDADTAEFLDHPQRRKCDPCLGHTLIEERTKLVDKIPDLLDFRANAKGGGVVAAIVTMFLVSLMFTNISQVDADEEKFEGVVTARMQKHEDSIAASTEKQQQQMEKLIRITNEMNSSIQTFIATHRLMQIQAEKEIERLSTRIEKLELRVPVKGR